MKKMKLKKNAIFGDFVGGPFWGKYPLFWLPWDKKVAVVTEACEVSPNSFIHAKYLPYTSEQ